MTKDIISYKLRIVRFSFRVTDFVHTPKEPRNPKEPRSNSNLSSDDVQRNKRNQVTEGKKSISESPLPTVTVSLKGCLIDIRRGEHNRFRVVY